MLSSCASTPVAARSRSSSSADAARSSSTSPGVIACSGCRPSTYTCASVSFAPEAVSFAASAIASRPLELPSTPTRTFSNISVISLWLLRLMLGARRSAPLRIPQPSCCGDLRSGVLPDAPRVDGRLSTAVVLAASTALRPRRRQPATRDACSPADEGMPEPLQRRRCVARVLALAWGRWLNRRNRSRARAATAGAPNRIPRCRATSEAGRWRRHRTGAASPNTRPPAHRRTAAWASCGSCSR